MTEKVRPILPAVDGVTRLDFALAIENARERGDDHLMGTLIELFHANPQFMDYLLTEVDRRSSEEGRDTAQRTVYADGFLDGAALILSVQAQHAKTVRDLASFGEEIPLTSLGEIEPAA
jgi:hypothetical protein